MKFLTISVVLILLPSCNTLELDSKNEKLSIFAINMTGKNLNEKVIRGRSALKNESRCGLEKSFAIYAEVAAEIELISQILESQKELILADSLYEQLNRHFIAIDSSISKNRQWLGLNDYQINEFRSIIPKRPSFYDKDSRLIHLLDEIEKSCNRALSTSWPIWGCYFTFAPMPHLLLTQHDSPDSVFISAIFNAGFCAPEIAYVTICGNKAEVEYSTVKVSCLKSTVRKGNLNWEVRQVNTNTGQVHSLDGKWTSEVSWF